MRRTGVDEGLDPATGAVDQLVGNHQGAGLGLGLEATHRTWGQHLLNAETAQGPHVRAVVDPVWRVLVAPAVAR